MRWFKNPGFKPPAKPSSWRMQTNIKAQPGSQGTLFQGGADQMTAAKWPKHYTPERLHEVLPAVAPSKWDVIDDPNDPWDTAPERRKLVDTVARSTVPAEHLLGVQFSPARRITEMAQPGGEYASGRYTAPIPGGPGTSRPTRWAQGTTPSHIQITDTYAGTGTPIHEIGHHASYLRQGKVPYVTPEERGHEEGLADNYEQEHFRDRRGLPGQVPAYGGGLHSATIPPGASEWVQDRARERNTAFFDSYHAVRGTDPNPMETAYKEGERRGFTNPTLPGLARYNGYVLNTFGGV